MSWPSSDKTRGSFSEPHLAFPRWASLGSRGDLEQTERRESHGWGCF